MDIISKLCLVAGGFLIGIVFGIAADYLNSRMKIKALRNQIIRERIDNGFRFDKLLNEHEAYKTRTQASNPRPHIYSLNKQTNKRAKGI